MRKRSRSKKQSLHFLLGSTWGNYRHLMHLYGHQGKVLQPSRKLGLSAFILLGGPLRVYEKLRWSRRIAQTELHPSPVFIIGHWQAGHSPLHFMLSQDPQFGWVSLLHCALPSAFLTAGPLIERFLNRRIKKTTRQADSFPLTIRSPQGDDLLMAGVSDLSFYHAYAFPESAEWVFRRGVLFQDVSKEAIEHWQKNYVYLLKKVALSTGKSRLLLRNASNTGRIRQLLSLFPQAKFIHIYRNPYDVYQAVQQRWQGLLDLWSFQDYDLERMQEATLLFYELLMKRYFQDRELIPKGQLSEIRYEDLMSDPLSTLYTAYEDLDLPGFAETRPAIESYLEAESGSLGGQDSSDLDRKVVNLIEQRWGFAIDRLGYARRVVSGKQPTQIN